jgi:hypothetical protein
MNALQPIFAQLDDYKRKFYLNRLVKGIIFSLAVILTAFLVFNTLEFFGHFGKTFRGILFFSFVLGLLASLFFWVFKPLMYLYGPQKPLSNDDAAFQIGQFFPEISDKLINTLQLSRSLDGKQNELLAASIAQKSKQLGIVRFSDAINIKENNRYLKFAAIPAGVIALLLMLYPAFIADSSTRIVNFQNEFQEKAPFTFQLKNEKLQAFKNEDFTLSLSLMGNTIPESVYLLINGRKLRMETTDKKNYSYTFSKVQKGFDFTFEAAGFKSGQYEVELVQRPNLTFFEVSLNYPDYLNRPDETIKNVGNLTVPEGTVIQWGFSATETDSVSLKFDGDTKRLLADKKLISGLFEAEKRMKASAGYQVFLKNQFADNREGISYFVNVVPDKFPQIALEQYKDSTLYNFLVLSGNLTDDYGLSRLSVFYKVLRNGKNEPALAYKSVNLPINRSQSIQSFSFPWSLDSLQLNPADKMEYYVQVWDNDGVNGPKATRSQVMNYLVPDQKAIEKEIDNSIDKTEAQLDKTLEKAQKLKKDIQSLETRLKNKKDLDFQDKKLAEEIVKKREELANEIKELQQQNQNLNEKQQRFNEPKPEQQQKMDALQKLMNDLQDPETQKLYEELQKLMEQNQDEKMLDQMEKLKNKERNTERELDRLQALFKKLQLEQKMDKIVNELNKQAEQQEKLADKTDKADKNPDTNQKKNDLENIKKEQDKANKQFEDLKKEMQEAEKMSKEMKNKEPFDQNKEEQEDISNDQKNSQKDLENEDNQSASKKQKKASRQMKNLAMKTANQKKKGEMKEMEENIDDLRDILENLVTLSFDQERLMKDFRGINPSDPRFVKLSQEQLKLQDDAKVIEDSLYALSKRVMQIEAFVTREMGNMKRYMDESASNIKERRLQVIPAKQQFAMTSMNNLALLLSDVLKNMQMSMQNMAGSGKGSKKGNKPNPGSGMGKQQGELNQQIQQLSKQQKGQGGMSEQLAKLAREQGMLRKMIQSFLEQNKGNEKTKQLGQELGELMKKMEETETDLVNKRINPEVIQRQKDILTRLLESEKAMREQEEDTQRKAEQAKIYQKTIPAQFQEFVKQKQKQTELLRTVPPNLNTYYKRQVDSYFKKIQ